MPMRITGLSSGMDIDKMVSDLMKAENIPLDKMLQKQQTLIWKEEQYRAINSKLASFRDTLNASKYSFNWNSLKATSQDPSAVSVTADTTASATSHTITVTSLASGATKSSTAGISNVGLVGSALSGSTTITAGSNDQLSVTLNGTNRTITLDAGTYTNSQLQAQLQSKLDLAFGANQIKATLNASSQLQLDSVGTAGNLPQIQVNAAAGNTGLSALGFTDGQSYKIAANVQLGSQSSKLATALTYGDFLINGQDITYSSTDTLQDIINRVNNSAAGVTMSYDSISDKIVFNTKGTGVAAQVQLQNGASGNFIAAMNLDTTVVTGQDANVTIDGVQTYQSSNRITQNGVTYNLNATTSGSITVNVAQDTDAIFNKIKDLVDQYNDMIKTVDSKRLEPRYYDYSPLTADQKSSMKDADIQNWEDKAKSGLLKGDSILNGVSSNLRSIINTTVQGVSSSSDALYKIGITTKPYDSKNQTEAGTLQIDEDKLRSAIENDPQGVINLFTNYPGSNPSTDQKGIVYQMYDQVTNSINQLIDKAGGVSAQTDDITFTLGEQIHDLGTSADELKAKLSTKEDFYYKQFTAMENAISTANQQASWLAQLGG